MRDGHAGLLLRASSAGLARATIDPNVEVALEPSPRRQAEGRLRGWRRTGGAHGLTHHRARGRRSGVQARRSRTCGDSFGSGAGAGPVHEKVWLSAAVRVKPYTDRSVAICARVSGLNGVRPSKAWRSTLLEQVTHRKIEVGAPRLEHPEESPLETDPGLDAIDADRFWYHGTKIPLPSRGRLGAEWPA